MAEGHLRRLRRLRDAAAPEDGRSHRLRARDTKLGEIAKSGTLVNADPTRELIGNVFFNKAPLHDGAMIIRDGRVYAAGCILPLSDNLQISRDLGTRGTAPRWA